MEEDDREVYHFQVADIHIKQKPLYSVDGKLSNGLSFKPLRQLGYLQRIISSNSRCLDQKRVVYCSGASVILYDLNTNQQKVYSRSCDQSQISALVTFKNVYQQDFIMYASSGGSFYPQVEIINVPKDKRKSYKITQLQRQQVIKDVCFFLQGTAFICLSQWVQHSRITIVDAQSSELKGFQELPFHVDKIHTHQAYSNLFVMMGERGLLMSEYQNSSLNIHSLKIQTFLESDDRVVDFQIFPRIRSIVILTKMAYLYFRQIHGDKPPERIDLGTFITFDPQLKKEVTVRKRPSCLSVSNYYILIGYQLEEKLTLITIPILDQTDRIVRQIDFRCPLLHKIVCMNFSQQNTSVHLVVQFKEKRLSSAGSESIQMKIISQFLNTNQDLQVNPSKENHLLPPGKLVPVMLSFLMQDTQILDYYKDPMEQILGKFVFHKPVIGIAMSFYLSVAAVISGDRKFKAFKLKADSCSIPNILMFQNQFQENPLCIGMHPVNGQVAIGFKQSLRIFIMTQQALIQSNFNIIIKNVQAICYSQMGHRVAVSSGNQIQIFEPYYFRHLATLTHHSPNSSIKHLEFMNKDSLFMSCCTNGVTYIYSVLQNYQKIFQHVSQRTNRALVVAYDHIFDFLIVSYPDSHVKFFRSRGQLQYAIMTTYPDKVTSLKVCNQFGILFMGFSNGMLRAYRWPFNNIKKLVKNYTSVMLHQGPVSIISKSPNLCFLLTAGLEDCCLSLHEIKAVSQGIYISQAQLQQFQRRFGHQLKMIYCLNNSCFTTKYMQQLRKQSIRQYGISLNEFASEIKQSQFVYEKDIKMALDQQQHKQQLIKQKQDQHFVQIRQTFTQKKKRIEKKMNQMIQFYERNKSEMEQQTQDALKQLYQQNNDLIVNRNRFQGQAANQIQKTLLDNSNQTMKQLKELQEQQKDFENMLSEKEKELSNNRLQEVQVFRQEKSQHQQLLVKQLQKKTRLLNDNNLKRQQLRNQKISKHENQIKRLKGRTKELTQLLAEIQNEIKFLEEDKRKYQHQMTFINKFLKEKEEIINEKEQAAKQAMRKNLYQKFNENSKTYKLTELQELAAPMVDHLQRLQSQQSHFYQQFLAEAKTRKEFEKQQQQLLSSIEVLKQKLQNVRLNSFISNRKVSSVKSQIQLSINNFDQIKNDLKFIYKKSFGKDEELDLSQYTLKHQQSNLRHKGDVLLQMRQRSKRHDFKEIRNSEKKQYLTNNQTIVLLNFCNSHKLQNHQLRNKLNELKRKFEQILNSDSSIKQSFSYPNLDIFQGDSSLSMVQFKPLKPLPFEIYEQEKKKIKKQVPKAKIYGVSEMLRQLNKSIANAKQKHKSSFANLTNDQTLSIIRQVNDSSYVQSNQILNNIQEKSKRVNLPLLKSSKSQSRKKV